MKKAFKLIGIIALVVVIGFSFAACDNGNGNDNGTGGGGGGGGGGGNIAPLFSVSGEFQGTGTGNALFTAATTETVSTSAKPARSSITADASYELTGELEDGDMLFRLSGTYDSSTGSYTVSAASSFARYTVNGDASGATATLAVKSNDEWNSFIVSVTVRDEVTITSDDDSEDEYDNGGLPSWAQGSWHDWWTEDNNNYNLCSFEAWSYFNQWYYEAWKSSVWHDNWEFTSIKYTVIEAEEVEDGVYDVIFSYPFYPATQDQKKAALEKFFQENNHPAEFWDKDFNPWDPERWVWYDEEKDIHHNYEDSVIWYICLNEDHEDSYMGPKIINWDTFVKFFSTEEEQGEFWGAIDWENSTGLWARIEDVEAFLAEKEVQSWYYWGWHEADYDNEVLWAEGGGGPEDYAATHYTCWAPSCEDGGQGGWWDKTHYYVKWWDQTGIQGDWDTYGDLFSKWNSDDYLITYLRDQNVQPETWYTRVRMWMDGDTFRVYYYNGDKEAETSESHSAPACDTKDFSKIKGLTSFDPVEYPDWSYLWVNNRTSPRLNDD